LKNIPKAKALTLLFLFAVFCLQTYFTFVNVIPGYAEPFLEDEQLYSFIQAGFTKVWSMSLFWPAILFGSLAADIVSSIKATKN